MGSARGGISVSIQLEASRTFYHGFSVLTNPFSRVKPGSQLTNGKLCEIVVPIIVTTASSGVLKLRGRNPKLNPTQRLLMCVLYLQKIVQLPSSTELLTEPLRVRE